MSLHALPILFINLGGEMVYILDQRLKAQEIQQVKAQKVINDIVGAMFNAQFVDELFRLQELQSRLVLKQAFNRVAHASIMRLNETSMDKLYDLILMAFKYQTTFCPKPSELLTITLNHLNTLFAMVGDQRVIQLVADVNHRLVKKYGNMNESEFQFIRYTLMDFFQDIHIRVSMFLRDESQNPNGRFVVPISGTVPFGTEVPGSIRQFLPSGELRVIKHFANGGRYQASGANIGGRATKLGTNTYNMAAVAKTTLENALPSTSYNYSSQVGPSTEVADVPSLAKEELDFLAQLIGCNKSTPDTAEFRLHLFDFSGPDEQTMENKEKQVIKECEIKWTQTKANEELSRIISEMENTDLDKTSVGGERGSGEDLLDLMDSACK